MLGCHLNADGAAEFLIWAPRARAVTLVCVDAEPRRLELARLDDGYYFGRSQGPMDGARYWLELDGQRRRPDPASRSQPEGLFGPSQVMDLRYDWNDQSWTGRPWSEQVVYELHVGCYSPTHDFLGVQRRLDRLVDLGITAIELMPVAQFPGRRNWGYDGALLYAVHNTYGGPRGLQELVDACHQRGLAVILDVVYNHLGPEGNYLAEFGPYFTDRYHTPWGAALNFDDRDSDHVRRFFIENARYWIRDFHLDGLRLDAIQMIFDQSARPFLRDLAEAVHEEGRRQNRLTWVIGETNQNDVRQISPPAQGGLGLDAVWCDDFHHGVHALLTGERISVFQDYGSSHHIAKAIQQGFVLDGQYSRHYRKHHGSSAAHVPPDRFVVCVQNHDQVGNRLYGERLGALVDFERLKLAAALLLLAPQVPLLFMGEEYAETAPFLFFVDHNDPHLRRRVRDGRLRDCAAFLRPDRAVPDPTHPAAFRSSQLHHALALQGHHLLLWKFYQQLIALRRRLPNTTKSRAGRHQVALQCDGQVLICLKSDAQRQSCMVLHLAGAPTTMRSEHTLMDPQAIWEKVLDSADHAWLGGGPPQPDRLCGDAQLTLAPHSATVYTRQLLQA